MKPVCVLFSSDERRTKEVAFRITRELRKQGLTVDVRDLSCESTKISSTEYSAVLLTVSEIASPSRPEMVQFIRLRCRHQIEATTTAFLSVNLNEDKGQRTVELPGAQVNRSPDVKQLVHTLFNGVERHPMGVKRGAKAFLYSTYNFAIRIIMRRAVAHPSDDVNTLRDLEDRVGSVIDQFVAELAQTLKAELSVAEERETTVSSVLREGAGCNP